MKTVVIPNDYNPFEIEINGRVYVYKAGETVSVPDDVASAIEQYNASKPVAKPNSIIDNLGMAFNRTDAGKALMVNEAGTDVEWSESLGGLVEAAEDAAKSAEEAEEAAKEAKDHVDQVAESIPQDYTTLSGNVDDLLDLGLSVVDGKICLTYNQ